jgi:hypothetical protein
MTPTASRLCRASALLALSCLPFAADAHIQWFANVDLSGNPRSPWDVMTSPSFAGLALLALAVLAAAGAVDAWLARAAGGHRLLGRVHAFDIGARGLLVMRGGMALFFVANVLFFRDAPVILTPELKSSSHWTDLLQLGTAAALLLGRVRLAAAALVALFGYAMMGYGVFHLSEYPIFLGIAAYLALAGGAPAWRVRATAFLRVTVALSLMWGGVEKWLFPEWTYPLLCGSGRDLLMGLSPDFFMQCAGFVEFCLSFVLIVGSVAARVAALALCGVFILAMPMFGMIDVVGHLPFLLALAVAGLSPNTLARRFGHAVPGRQAAHWAAAFAGALGGLPAFYYGTHQLAFGRATLAPVAPDLAVAVAVFAAAVTWLAARGAEGGRRPGRA